MQFRSRCALIAAHALFFASIAQAASPAGDPIAPLLQQLGADSWQKRDQAQKSLVLFGDEAAPQLQKLLASTGDEEIRTRARAALLQIDENRMAGPSYVTLDFKDTHPRKIFEALAKQAQVEFRCVPDNLWESRNWRPVTIKIERQPFWVAMRELCEKSGLVQQYGYNLGNGRCLVVGQSGGSWISAPSTVSEAFLVAATQIHRSNTVNLTSANGQHDEFNIQFMAYGEPKLRVIQYASNVKLIEAVDDHGNSLLDDEPADVSLSSGGTGSWSLYARLKYPQSNSGKRIARLKGEAFFVLQTGAHKVELPDIMSRKDVSKTIAGHRYCIKRAEQQDHYYSVQVRIDRDGRTDQEWSSLQTNLYYNNGIELRTADGQTLQYNGSSAVSSTGDSLEMTYQFSRYDPIDGQPRQESPLTLVWEIPTDSKLVSIPFEFKDLPLP